MKILKIDYAYYYYPENVNSLDSFIEYLNTADKKFIKLICLDQENCVEPYFIKEDAKERYLNVNLLKTIYESEGTVLTRAEYDKRLAEAVKNKCLDCVHYTEDSEGDNLIGHREKLSLDCKCWSYEKKEQ